MIRTTWIVVILASMVWIVTSLPALAQEEVLSPQGAATLHEIHIPKGSDNFEPAVLKIKVGEVVKWINEDERKHVIASIPGKGTNDKELFAPAILPGQSWSHTFNKAGEYPYFCYIHYVMMGVVIVEEGQEQSK